MSLAVEVAPGIRRVLAPNPGPMTGPGTNTYLVGRGAIAVVDPGPAIAPHLDAILAEAGAPVTSIWLTHAHPDHASAVGALQARTGAPLVAWATPNPTYVIEDLRGPEWAIADGEWIEHDEERYRALHTPGHASDHLCFWRPEDGVLFTGDVVVGKGTVVIAPPDGHLADYLATLERLRALPPRRILPGHGDPIEDAVGKLTEYLEHRLARERQVLEALSKGEVTLDSLLDAIYAAVDPRLRPVAAQQLQGHLEKLVAEGRATPTDQGWR